MGWSNPRLTSSIGDSPYVAIGHLVFENGEKMQKGLEAHDPALAADLVNFSDRC